MFTSFPKLFDKNFAIGFLLPAILALFALAWIYPSTAVLEPLRTLTASEKALGDLTYLALLTYGFAILLMTTNTLQYRLLEGYLPPLSWCAPLILFHRWLRKRWLDEHADLTERWKIEKEAFPAADEARDDKLRIRLNGLYPPERLDVMPTFFGNIIRAFEAYPMDVYGVDATPMWLRLGSVISKDFADGIEDARAQVNVFLNLCFLLPIVVLAAAVAIWRQTPWPQFWMAEAHGQLGHWRLLPATIVGVVALVATPFVYLMALSAARAWGEVVKAAFDCYLPSLPKQLGYAPPSSEAERNAFWGEINGRIVYWDRVDPAIAKIADAPKPHDPDVIEKLRKWFEGIIGA